MDLEAHFPVDALGALEEADTEKSTAQNLGGRHRQTCAVWHKIISSLTTRKCA